jgi:hypothetical protein
MVNQGWQELCRAIMVETDAEKILTLAEQLDAALAVEHAPVLNRSFKASGPNEGCVSSS